MLTRRIFTIGIAALAVTAVSATGCSRKNDQEIPIGAFFSLSGSDSTFGSDSKEGIDLAVILNALRALRVPETSR